MLVVVSQLHCAESELSAEAAEAAEVPARCLAVAGAAGHTGAGSQRGELAPARSTEAVLLSLSRKRTFPPQLNLVTHDRGGCPRGAENDGTQRGFAFVFFVDGAADVAARGQKSVGVDANI